MLIVLSGGGTGGSVTPILAIAEELKKINPRAEFLFIGTKKGVPEKELAGAGGIFYQSICSGKLRRYFSWRNCFDPFLVLLGFFQSLFIILKYKPAAIVSAGGFVAVPLSWAGWLCRTPVFIHQQDIIPGLANKLITPLAKKITVSFSKSLKDFSKRKTVLTGNPIRTEIAGGDKKRAVERFNLETNLPTLLVVGGGTGAKKINELIYEIAPELVKFCQVIHLTGRQKPEISNLKPEIPLRYHQYQFLNEEMPDALAAADLVVSRAGMGFLTELASLGKPTILIPIQGSHQELNARHFAGRKAVILTEPKDLTSPILLEKIRQLIFSPDERSILSLNISRLAYPGAAKKIAGIILENIRLF